MKKLRVGVIGTGVMGQNHLKVYARLGEVELVGIADSKEELVSSLSRGYETEGYTDYQDLLKRNLDIVSIVVPTTLHKEVALDSLSAGVNILVEKPLADTIEAAREIVNEAEKKRLKLLVGHIERFNPAVKRLKEIIEEGILGEIASISCRRVGPYTPRTYDTGVILDLGTHDIDIISYLYKEKVREVYAIAGSEFRSFEDHASLMLRFNNGNAGVIEANWLTPHKVRRLSAVGQEGVATLDFLEQKVIIQDKQWSREAKVEHEEPLMREIKHFIDVVKNDKEPLVSGEDSIHALAVALAAIRSYQEGRIVKLSEVDNL